MYACMIIMFKYVSQIAASFFTIAVTIKVDGNWTENLKRTNMEIKVIFF